MADTHDILSALIARIRCKAGWSFRLVDEGGAKRLVITVAGTDSRSSDRLPLTVSHYFPVPIAAYNEQTWRRWIFECCRKVEDHELGEWFLDGDERPFAPLHGPGEDPYTVHEFRDVVDAHTNQDGSVRKALAAR